MSHRKTDSSLSRIWLVTVMFIVSFCAVEAKADTIALSGGVSVTGFTQFFNVNISGFNTPATTFSASGMGSTIGGINVPRPTLAPGGTSINLSGSLFLVGADFNTFGSSVVINGIVYDVNSVSTLMQSATTVTIPFSTATTLALSAPCTVTGSVSGRAFPVPVGAAFSGNCFATLGLTRGAIDAQGNGLYNFASISYGFSAVPTPEPATLLLIGTGLVGIALKVKRQKKQSSV